MLAIENRAAFRRGITRIQPVPQTYITIAERTKLTAAEVWTVCHALHREFRSILHTAGPQDYIGRVWEAAIHVEKERRPVTPSTVWASAQGKIRTWDCREMANAVSVPRPRKGRKSKAEEAKRLAMRPVRLEVAAAHDDWVPGTLLEEHIAVDSRFPAPDKDASRWEEHLYSTDDTHKTLLQVLEQNPHPGAQLLREVVTCQGDRLSDEVCPVLGPALGTVASKHGLRVKEALASITEFAQGIGADVSTILSVLRERGPYAAKHAPGAAAPV